MMLGIGDSNDWVTNPFASYKFCESLLLTKLEEPIELPVDH